MFVHSSVHDKYVAYLKEIADSKVVGDPFKDETTNGAIISELQFKKILDYVKSGKDAGAKVATGGERLGSKGYFMRPTVFTDVKDDMKIAKEEVFINTFIVLFCFGFNSYLCFFSIDFWPSRLRFEVRRCQ